MSTPRDPEKPSTGAETGVRRRPRKRRRRPFSKRLRHLLAAGRSDRPEARRERRGRRRDAARLRRRLPKPTAAGVAAAITRFGDRSSRVIRGVLAPLAVPLVGLAAVARKGLARLAVVMTPLRAALAATAIAAIILGISQFVDYRGVAVGVSDYAAYADAELVAPAPQVDRQPAGSAHAYLLLPLAAIALVLLFLCARGRWQLGRVVSLIGLLAIAVTLVVDVRAGLDEGTQAVAYAGAEAQLIEGFYVQLFSAAVIVAGGLLVSHYARRSRRRQPRSARRTSRVGPARASAA